MKFLTRIHTISFWKSVQTSRRSVFIASLFLFGIYLLSFLMSYDLRNGPYWHDFSSFLLMAVNSLKDMGVPYVDYWDIKPPGLIALLMGWVSLFGYEGRSFVVFPLILECITVFSILMVTWQLTRRLPLYVLLALAQIPILRSLDGEMYLNSEFIGSPFSLLGLAFLVLAIRNSRGTAIIWAGLSAISLTFSGLIKDPFLPAAGALILLLPTKKGGLKFTVGIIFSALTVLFLALWLLSMDAWSAYLDVLNFKRDAFQIDLSLRFLLGLFLKVCTLFPKTVLGSDLDVQISIILLFLALTASLWKGKKIHFAAVFLWVMGNLAGYILQNRSGGHYDVQLLAPAALGLSALCLLSTELMIFFLRKFHFSSPPVTVTSVSLILLSLLMGGGLLAHHDMLKRWNDRIRFSRYSESLQNIITKPEKYNKWVKKADLLDHFLDPGESILVVYGWDVGAYYLYLNRQPATRYFIVHPFIMREKQNAEFRQQFLASPPGAIIYKLRDSDMNVNNFEANILPLRDIISKDYVNLRGYSHLFIRSDLFIRNDHSE